MEFAFDTNYISPMKACLDGLDRAAMKRALDALKDAYLTGKHIFVAGNGGSGATANHFSCDFSKNAVNNPDKQPKVITLSSNTEYITAIGNDIAFEDIFSRQLDNLMEDGDLLILISASGNSPDIVNAAQYAKKKHGTVIGLSGFEGGKLKELSDVSIHVPVKSYEMAEDMHSIILHMFVCAFKSQNW